MILPIMEIPDDLHRLCTPYQSLFSKPQFSQFEKFITGLMVSNEANLDALSEGYRAAQSYDRLHHFVSNASWDINDVLEKTVSVIKQMPTDRTFTPDGMLVIDDTLIEKYGKLMEGAGKLWDHSQSRWLPYAHNLVGLAYANHRHLRYGLKFEMYNKKETSVTTEKEAEEAGKPVFKTKIQIGREMIDWATEQGILYQTIVFDSWFFCKEFVDHIESLKKDWISMSKSNRKIIHEGKEIPLADYAKTLDPNTLPTVTVDDREYAIKSIQVRMPCLARGKETIRLVVCYEKKRAKAAAKTEVKTENPTEEGGEAQEWKEPVYLVSNRKDIRPERLIRSYQIRWSIETFFRDTKSELGLEGYQMRKLNGIKSHWCLVFTSAVLLELLRLEVCSKEGIKRADLSFGQLRSRAWGRSLRSIITWCLNQHGQGLSPEEMCIKLQI
jgi:SRSO17 transposase